jgi:hypothetical protein
VSHIVTFYTVAQDVLCRVSSVPVFNGSPVSLYAFYKNWLLIYMINRMGWDFAISALPYGQKWRTHRRAFHQMFHADAILKYRPVQLNKIHDLLRHFAEDPKDFREHLRTLAALRKFCSWLRLLTMFQVIGRHHHDDCLWHRDRPKERPLCRHCRKIYENVTRELTPWCSAL